MTDATPSRLQDFLTSAEGRLTSAGIETAALDVRLLVGHALGLNRLEIVIQKDRSLSEVESKNIDMLLERRIAREPVSRILGSREFWGLPFSLNEATLDPRSDSETLIEGVLRSIDPSFTPGKRKPSDLLNQPFRILDLGTGSGCLLLALLSELPHATGIGIDWASSAIDAAKSNAARLNLSERSSFERRNWLEGMVETFDIIVSNPPYIRTDEIDDLMPEVSQYDPRLALDGGADGLGPYRSVIPDLYARLKTGGLIAFEIGEGQKTAVDQLLTEAGLQELTSFKDFSGIERSIIARKAKV